MYAPSPLALVLNCPHTQPLNACPSRCLPPPLNTPSQVKTIDTPRVRFLPQTELKKRQAAVEAYTAALQAGPAAHMAAAEAIDALCPGESSSDEDTSGGFRVKVGVGAS